MSKDRIFKITLYALLFSVIVASAYAFIDKSFNVATFVSVASTFAIAILTVAYVSTTSQQLHVMQRQMDESIKSRELAFQPLPIIGITKLKLQKPRFYYSPPEDIHCVLSRYFADFEIKNSGNSPAICVSVVGSLCCYDHKEEKMYEFSSKIQDKAPENFSVLAEKDKLPKNDLMFINDPTGEFLFGLRNSNKTPLIVIEIFYKNILGACFLAKQHFTIDTKNEEQDEILANWHTNISSFERRFSDDLNRLRTIHEKDRKEWNRLFDEVKKSFAALIVGEDQEVSAREIPDGLSVTVISESDYNRGIQKTYMGKLLSRRFSGLKTVHHDSESDTA